MSTRVAVVGGGISGLAAGFYAQQRGAEVALFEADGRIGGKIQTSPLAGVDVNEGPDAFLARVPEAIDLCRAVGLEPDLVTPAQRHAFLFVDGALRPIPQPMVLGVPLEGAPLVASGVTSAAGEAGLAADLARTETPPDHGDSIGRLIRSRMGDEILERLVDPLLGGINAGDADRLSVAASAPQFAAVADEPSLARALARQRRSIDPDAPIFYTVRGGLARLTGAVADALTGAIRCDAPVTELRADGPQWVVTTPGERWVADHVILTTPSGVTSRLLTPLIGPSPLDEIEYSGVVLAALAYDPVTIEHPLDGSGFLVPRSEGLLMTAATWSSAKWAHLQAADPQGKRTAFLRVSAGRFGDTRALEMTDDEFIAAARADLVTTMGLRAEPTAVRVTRYPDSFPQYTPGHLDRVDAIEQQLAAFAGLHLAGAPYRGVGIPACIRHAKAAVGRALEGAGTSAH
ncbi:MAG: protoporphyrinogen oxidase [Acidimicrobiales bacterium]|nr:protoporphyrinogen oxidase [Acidimicrobiales bacterium]